MYRRFGVLAGRTLFDWGQWGVVLLPFVVELPGRVTEEIGVGDMDLQGVYGTDLVKAFKLTEVMQDAIRETRFAPKSATVKGLVSRGLMTDRVELTDLGEHVRTHLMGELNCYTCGEPERLARQDAEVAKMLSDDATPTQAAQAAAVAFYQVATSPDAEISWGRGPAYLGALETLRQACQLAYPDIAFQTIRNAIGDSFNEGERLDWCIEGWVAAMSDGEIGHLGIIAEPIVTNELPGDAERAYDAENARLEGLSIEAEQLAEVEFETMLARLDMDMGDYEECRDQLAMERQGCWQGCGYLENGPFVPCKDHASVEAWVAHLNKRVARVTAPSAWKTSNGRRAKSRKGWRK